MDPALDWRNRVRTAHVVFWDFDGVIKESVAVKTQAFVRLFEPFGAEVAARVRDHHEMHGGMSRFEKLPLYLRFAGEEPTAARVAALCDAFADAVRDAVVAAPWVAGAESALRRRSPRQRFVLVSATPQGEMESIVEALDLRRCFDRVVGAPTGKSAAIRAALADYGVAPADALMIGDARADLDAAAGNGVPFLLRRHEENARVFAAYDGPSCADFTIDDNERSETR